MKKKTIILIISFTLLILALFHLLSTDDKSCFYHTDDNQFEVCYSEYNYSKYLNLYHSQRGKITINDILNNTTIHTIHYQHFNSSNIRDVEWSLDSVHFVGDIKNSAYKLPRKLNLENISDRYITRIPLVERISNTYDFNKDGIFDKYALVSDDTGYFVVLFLMKNDGNYREIKSGYIEDKETLNQIQLTNNGEIEVIFNEDKRALKWNRIVRLSFDLKLNNLIIIDDIVNLDSKKHSNIKIIKTQTIKIPFDDQYTFATPEKLTSIRHDYYYYKENENHGNPPKEYIETLAFLDSLNHYSEVTLKPQEYNLSKFVNYHGAYHRDLENGATVKVNEQGTIELNYLKALRIKGNNTMFSNFSVNGALISINNSSITYIDNIEMYHDVDEGSCSAPVVEVTNSSAINLFRLTLDGSGLVGLSIYNSSVSLLNSKITNCWHSALRLNNGSHLELQYTIIEKNKSSSILYINNSEIKFTNCTIRKNTIKTFFEKGNNSEIWIDDTNIYNNFSEDKLSSSKYGNKNFNNKSNQFELFSNLNTTRNFYKQLNSKSNYNAFLGVSNLKKQIKATAITNETVSTYNDIAYYAEQFGAFKEAVFLLEKIIEKFPNRTVAYINIGDAYWQISETDKAKKAYATYVDKMKNEMKEHKIPQQVKNRLKM